MIFFEVSQVISKARNHALSEGPVLIEAKTFRMRGHEEASGTFYVPDERFKEWKAKDPIDRLAEWLKENQLVSGDEELASIEKEIDNRFSEPLDFETVKKSVVKTNKVLLLQEPSVTLGPMSELSYLITEEYFKELDAPVMRCFSFDIPVPFNSNLEEGYLANTRLHEKLKKLLAY